MCGLFVVQPKLNQPNSEDNNLPARPVAAQHLMRQASTRERVNAIMGTPLSRHIAEDAVTIEDGGRGVRKEHTKTSQEVYVSSRMNSYTTLRVESATNNNLDSQPYHITARRNLRLKRSVSSPLAETCLSTRVRRQDVYSRRSLIIMPSPISPIKEHDQEHDCMDGELITRPPLEVYRSNSVCFQTPPKDIMIPREVTRHSSPRVTTLLRRISTLRNLARQALCLWTV